MTVVLYALFMLAVLIVLLAIWRGHRVALPMLLATLAVLSAFLVSDMTTPLTLNF